MLPYTLAFWLMALLYAKVTPCNQPDWGFFGHRKINKMAVFTLPEEMLPLYKTNIDYLEEHAADPDKRRYASPFEAIRHYIDLDQWGHAPFKNLPRDWNAALASHTGWYIIRPQGDTISLKIRKINDDTFAIDSIYKYLSLKCYERFFRKYILPQYHDENWTCHADTVNRVLGLSLMGKYYWKDTLSEHGILPYYLSTALNKLTKAFIDGNTERILQYSSELGHYIGDAHVPLHTTRNYNGQFTGQHGIHAFWESRLPELFADAQYDFFAGKATYIEDPAAYFWNIVLKSHDLMPVVLEKEKSLSEIFPPDNQFCYDERLGKTVRIQCREYAKAYHDSMNGMVEDRMREAILSVGSAWYTAWVNAGQPDLRIIANPSDAKKIIQDDSINANRAMKAGVREHEN